MNKRKGISLIVLIITIVVIIILAAAVILTISKNNPVESAKKATFVGDISSYQDELSMYIGNEYIKAHGNYDIASLDDKPLESVIEINSKYNEKFTIKNGKIAGTDKLSDQEKEWTQSVTGGTGSVTPPDPPVDPEDPDPPTPPAPTYPTNYTDPDGKKAYIPTGLTVSTVESEKKIDTGLVIKDSKGNEFVWIPVDFTDDADFATKFTRKQGYMNGSLQIDYAWETFEEPFSGANQSEIDEYNAMVASVKKYHGYYLARYEASNDSKNNAQSKPNVTPWTSIIWGKSMTDFVGGVVAVSRAMYPVATATTGSAVSTLPYGVQWDTAINFIENYGVKDTIVRQNSTGKGNLNTETKINTGSNAAYALNNIYDLAGNASEWTMEAYPSTYRVYRSGSYKTTANALSISTRIYNGALASNTKLGFRVALYIM